jgi:hypothetical protein
MSPIVQQAVEALRTLGVNDRPTAERLLSSWAHLKDLTDEQRVEVLAAFEDLVDRAEKALRSWSGELSVEVAARLLDSWEHVGELTLEERGRVLARFAEPPAEHISRVSRCGTCHEFVEFVAPPEGAGPAWGPGFWRHVEAANHPAKVTP